MSIVRAGIALLHWTGGRLTSWGRRITPAIRSSSKRIRERGWRSNLRSVLPPLVGVALLGFSLWQVKRVLPVQGAPVAAPPVAAALPPDVGLHTTSNGYVIALSLSVQSCSNPVRVSAAVVLPTQYYAAERNGPGTVLTKALLGFAVDDPSVRFQSMRLSDWRENLSHRAYPSWQTSFRNPYLVAGVGRADALRLDDWSAEPREVDAAFTANWLYRRGFGSCWLRLPSLVGGYVPNLADQAADGINNTIGRISGATSLGSSSSVNATYHVYGPNGTIRTYHVHSSTPVEYVAGDVPASIGYVTLASPLSIIPGESEGPAPQVGVPHWSCEAPPGQYQYQLFNSGVGEQGAFEYFNPPSLKAFSTTTLSDCSGVIALAEPGSQSAHDLWLLIIGSTISVGVGLLIDTFVRRTREKPVTSEKASSSPPSAPAEEESSKQKGRPKIRAKRGSTRR